MRKAQGVTGGISKWTILELRPSDKKNKTEPWQNIPTTMFKPKTLLEKEAERMQDQLVGQKIMDWNSTPLQIPEVGIAFTLWWKPLQAWM